MAAATQTDASVLSLLGAGRTLIADKAAPLTISADDEPVIFTANYASVLQKHTYSAGVLGHLWLRLGSVW